jgi:hypothetical protein
VDRSGLGVGPIRAAPCRRHTDADVLAAQARAVGEWTVQLRVSTKGIHICGLTRSPVRGIFSIERLHDLIGEASQSKLKFSAAAAALRSKS